MFSFGLSILSIPNYLWSTRQIGERWDSIYGDLEEEVYIDYPESMVDIDEDEALLLQSTMYGLVHTRTKCKALLQESDQYVFSKIWDLQEVR